MRESSQSKQFGAWGEETAAEYLRRKGYTIVGLNYRVRGGEIDIIARNRKFLIFVEVKTRKNTAFAQAREYITEAKQRRIIYSAQLWLGRIQRTFSHDLML
jgi:putative endonuclease